MAARARFWLTIAACVLFAACGGGSGGGEAMPAAAPPPPPPVAPTIVDLSQPWQEAQPATVGIDEIRLNRAVADCGAIPRCRSLLVARHGKLASENYLAGTDRSTRFDVRSVTKSVVSLLVGIAIQSGTLGGLDTTVGEHVGAPYTLDAGDRAVTVRELLTMTSRYQWDESRAEDYNLWVTSSDHLQYLFDRRQTVPAGEFVYNSAAVNLLGFMLQHAAGRPLPQFADEVLFQPIGITSAVWEDLEPGMVNGGSGISMTGQDLLRIGQLALQRGRSGTRQVVPESWITATMTPQFAWRDTSGAQRGITYGYLWWLADSPATPAWFAWGYGGQFVYVVPSLDMTIVMTTQWQGISSETDPVSVSSQLLTIIVNDVLAAVN